LPSASIPNHKHSSKSQGNNPAKRIKLSSDEEAFAQNKRPQNQIPAVYSKSLPITKTENPSVNFSATTQSNQDLPVSAPTKKSQKAGNKVEDSSWTDDGRPDEMTAESNKDAQKEETPQIETPRSSYDELFEDFSINSPLKANEEPIANLFLAQIPNWRNPEDETDLELTNTQQKYLDLFNW
jgi:hypothetical protein